MNLEPGSVAEIASALFAGVSAIAAIRARKSAEDAFKEVRVLQQQVARIDIRLGGQGGGGGTLGGAGGGGGGGFGANGGDGGNVTVSQ